MHKPFAPLIAIAQPASSPPKSTPTLSGIGMKLKIRHLCDAPIQVTHLVKKSLPMRHKTSAQHLNPLKKSGLKRHDYELHTQERMRHPSQVVTAAPVNTEPSASLQG